MRLLYDRAPTLHRFIVLTAANEPQARRALLRFGQSVLRSELRDKPFLVILPDLEARAVDYIGAFTSAAGKAGAEQVVVPCRNRCPPPSSFFNNELDEKAKALIAKATSCCTCSSCCH